MPRDAASNALDTWEKQDISHEFANERLDLSAFFDLTTAFLQPVIGSIGKIHN